MKTPCLNRELSFSHMPTFQLVSYGLRHRKDSSTFKWLARKSDYQFDHFRILDSFQACLLICSPICNCYFKLNPEVLCNICSLCANNTKELNYQCVLFISACIQGWYWSTDFVNYYICLPQNLGPELENSLIFMLACIKGRSCSLWTLSTEWIFN